MENNLDNQNSYINLYLKEAFSKLGKDQSEIIKDLGVSQPYVSNLMNGKKSVGKNMAEKLVSLYGFDKAKILTGEGSMLTQQIEEVVPDEEEEEDDTFTWTQEQFDALIEGDLDNKGKGGTNYKDIIKKHGLPDSEFDFTLGGYDTKKITYISIGDKIKTVTLTFAKQDNGQLLLIQKHAVGLGKSKQQNDSETRI